MVNLNYSIYINHTQKPLFNFVDNFGAIKRWCIYLQEGFFFFFGLISLPSVDYFFVSLITYVVINYYWLWIWNCFKLNWCICQTMTSLIWWWQHNPIYLTNALYVFILVVVQSNNLLTPQKIFVRPCVARVEILVCVYIYIYGFC